MKPLRAIALLGLLAFGSIAQSDFGTPGKIDRKSPFYQAFLKAAADRKPTDDSSLDLGAILMQWGDTWCEKGGSTLSEVSTGPWSSDANPRCGCRAVTNTWCTYQDYGYPCIGYDAGAKDINYGQPLQAPATPFVFEEWFDNDANSTSTSTFEHEESIENSYSVTMTKSVSATWSMSITAGLPDICQVNDDFSLNVSVTQSKTQTTTHSRSWSVSEQINIPPMSTIHAVMEVTKTTFVVPFQILAHFAGVGSVWCNDKVQGHWLWFPEAADMFSIGSAPCTYNQDGSADCLLNGTFVGLQGVDVHVNVTQCPLNTRCDPVVVKK